MPTFFGSSQLNSAVEQIDARISELEADIMNASSEAQARVSRDLKRAWESVYNALSLSPTPGGMSNSYATWAASSSPRARSGAMPNVPLGPGHQPTPAAATAPVSGDSPHISNAPADAVNIQVATSSITCGRCRKDAEDVLWVCVTCKGLYRMCNVCKETSSGPCCLLNHRLVAWPIKKHTLADDQYVICDHCSGAVVGLRWHCGTCKSFDSCNDCYIKHGRKSGHEHELKATYLSDTEAYPTETVTYTCSKCSSGIKSDQKAVLSCLQCNDFHLCAACFARGDMCNSHEYCAIAHPGKSISATAVDAASTAAPPASSVPNAGEKQNQPAEAKPGWSAARGPWHGRVPFNSMHSMHRGKPYWKHGAQQAGVVSAICDGCKNVITGVRHKCTRCNDFDLCHECYSNVSEVHPGHSFVHFGAHSGFGWSQNGKHGGGHHHAHPHPHHHSHADSHFDHGKGHKHGHEHRHEHEKGLGHAAAHAATMHAANKPPHRLAVCRLVHPPFDDVPLPPMSLPEACPFSPPSPPQQQQQQQSRCPPPPPLIAPLGCMMPRLPPSPSCCACPRIACPSTCQSTKVHTGVFCDACKQQIAGVRYKCGNCINYDLCERCEASDSHNADHLFVKIRRTIAEPVGKPMLSMVFPSPAEPRLKPAQEPPKASRAPSSSAVAPASVSPTAASAIVPVPVSAPARAVAPVASKSQKNANVTETSQFSAIFVEDVTIPDGTTMLADERFVKIWSVANMGDSEWPKGTMLVHMNGAPAMPGTRNVTQIVVGKRYEQVGIAVDLCAPAQSGRHTSMWRLMTPQGQYFGSMLWCTIEVQDSKVDDAKRSSSPAGPKQSATQAEEPEGLCIATPPKPSAPSAPLVEAAAAAAVAAVAIDIDSPRAANISASPSPSTASIESLSSTFVKIGADLMSEIKRIESSVKELHLRQNKLEETLSNNGSSASLHTRSSNKATSVDLVASADRAVSPIDLTRAPADAQLFMHSSSGCPSSCLHDIPEASEPAAVGRAAAHSAKAPVPADGHYSDIDLAKSPLLELIGALSQQSQQETRIAPWSPGARSDASSMRDFYSSAARLEDLLMSSRTGSHINTGSHPSSTSHTNHTSRTSLAFTDGGIASDVDAVDEYELINDFTDHSSMSPHSHHG
ncbi:hypothetical protein IWW45_000843 [Coemansia sp. RSA 485]|nr:hypothetical protein IWW45_000843 [Coemansia sp. RSA 485]